MFSSIYCVAFILLSASTLARECTWVPGPGSTAQYALDNEILRHVFRGVVTKRLKKFGDADVQSYVVRVAKVFKGCSFAAGEQVVVSTNGASPSCGVQMQVNDTFVLSGSFSTILESTKAQLSKNTKINQAVAVSPDVYSVKWSTVTAADLKLLKSFNNTGCLIQCSTGADCPTGNYCDLSLLGSCKPYFEKCKYTGPIKCGPTPCSIAPTCWISNTTCYTDYCHSCGVFHVDSTGTRVCY